MKAQTSPGLQVTYGNNGLERLAYNGVVLEDAGQNPGDIFHIWHIGATDLAGNPVNAGQYGWGELYNRRVWNPATLSWTYSYVWGSVSVQFSQSGDTLTLNVWETNNVDSGIVLQGVNIYPFVLHFPVLPAGFIDPSIPQLATNTAGPSVTLADYGSGEVATVNNGVSQPLYSGFLPAGPENAYTPIIGTTKIDSLPPFYPSLNRPLGPGQSYGFAVSLRFAPSATPTSALASDTYSNWRATWPQTLRWPDRRPIGTVYLASSGQGNAAYPAGYPNNPRRYYNDGNPDDFDIRTAGGLAAFQSRILRQAASNAQNAQQMNSQGVITWDIEGEEYPQDTSYVCQPDEIAIAAPEMESIVTDPNSGYLGWKLDDAYFQIMRNAGLRVGVCVRPQHFTRNPDGTAGQVFLTDGQVVAELVRKIQYAHDRWGATLYYVDSNVDAGGQTLSADLFQQVAATFPDSLIIPEHSNTKYYAYTAPFLSFLFLGQVSTPGDVYNAYPGAFSANLVNDVNPGTLAQNIPQLTAAVAHGDVLMAHADYWDGNDPTIVQIYSGAASPALSTDLPPARTHPVTVVGVSKGQVLSGTITISAQTSVAAGPNTCLLLVDGQAIAPITTQSPFIYSVDTTAFANGWHRIQAVVQGSDGRQHRARPMEFIVRN